MTTLTEQEMKLARFFIEREGDGVLDVIKNIDFMEQGLLDSLDMVTLAVFVQKEFGRKLDLTALTSCVRCAVSTRCTGWRADEDPNTSASWSPTSTRRWRPSGWTARRSSRPCTTRSSRTTCISSTCRATTAGSSSSSEVADSQHRTVRGEVRHGTPSFGFVTDDLAHAEALHADRVGAFTLGRIRSR